MDNTTPPLIEIPLDRTVIDAQIAAMKASAALVNEALDSKRYVNAALDKPKPWYFREIAGFKLQNLKYHGSGKKFLHLVRIEHDKKGVPYCVYTQVRKPKATRVRKPEVPNES